MSKRSARHADFTIERVYDAPQSLVFSAWADPAAKARWFGGPVEWERGPHKLDFRVGGRESLSGGPATGPVHTYNATYQDIVPNERIVSTYDMTLDGTRISVSLATVELFAVEKKKTRLVYTEQIVYLDDFEDPGGEGRKQGTIDLLDALGRALPTMAAS